MVKVVAGVHRSPGEPLICARNLNETEARVTHVNVEIKARCADQSRIREILRSSGADFKGTDHQVDTYFKVSSGRLKLREGLIENFLIYYEREGKAGPKESRVTLLKSEPGSVLKEILVKSLGVLVVVDKTREIYFIGNVKFHIDLVEGLGPFIEIEAMDADATMGKRKLHEQCSGFMRLLGIEAKDLVSPSYSDLLLQK